MTYQRDCVTLTCPCGHRFRMLANEYGDHQCPRCLRNPSMTADEWDGWSPYEQWTDAEHERSLIGWLERRVSMTTHVGVIASYVKTFETMWAEQFGDDTTIPADLKERVNAKLRLLREAKV